MLLALASLIWSTVSFSPDRTWESVEASVGTMTLTWKAAGCQRVAWTSHVRDGRWTLTTRCGRWGR